MCSVVYVRTNIVIDEELMSKAMEVAGSRTKRETVDRALRELVAHRRRLELLELAGLGWSGDLREQRLNRDLG